MSVAKFTTNMIIQKIKPCRMQFILCIVRQTVLSTSLTVVVFCMSIYGAYLQKEFVVYVKIVV